MRLENFILDSSGVYRAKEEGTPAGYIDGAEGYLLEVLGKSREPGIILTRTQVSYQGLAQFISSQSI